MLRFILGKIFYEKFSVFNSFLKRYQKIHLFFLSIPKSFFEVFIVLILLSSLYYFLKISNISPEIIILNLAIFAVSIFRIYPSIYRIAGCFQKGNYGKAVLLDLNDLFLKKNSKKNVHNNQKSFLYSEINSLILNNISFKYDNKDQPTLKKINFELEKNRFTGIKGETGAGKSTLVDIISGLLKSDSGFFIINGKKLNDLPTAGTKILVMYHKI